MRFDLKSPCRNCPFGNGPERITFACRERAQEIAESAYRRGFPCHLSATCEESLVDGDIEEGFVFRHDGQTQHCAGALAMFINDGYDSTPGTGNDEDLFERLAGQLELDKAFDCEEAFLDANKALRC